jgi:hypothetical protein
MAFLCYKKNSSEITHTFATVAAAIIKHNELQSLLMTSIMNAFKINYPKYKIFSIVLLITFKVVSTPTPISVTLISLSIDNGTPLTGNSSKNSW